MSRVDQFTYFGSHISSTESGVSVSVEKQELLLAEYCQYRNQIFLIK